MKKERSLGLGTSRRSFLSTAGMAAGASALHPLTFAQQREGRVSATAPIKLGVSSYTFRAFDRVRLIESMQQLKNTRLNAKDVKDHLPMNLSAEDAALEAYRNANIQVHAVKTVSFAKDEEDDMRVKFVESFAYMRGVLTGMGLVA